MEWCTFQSLITGLSNRCSTQKLFSYKFNLRDRSDAKKQFRQGNEWVVFACKVFASEIPSSQQFASRRQNKQCWHRPVTKFSLLSLQCPCMNKTRSTSGNRVGNNYNGVGLRNGATTKEILIGARVPLKGDTSMAFSAPSPPFRRHR